MSTWSGRWEFVAVLILICAALLWVKTTQLREGSGGARWDGSHYLNLAAQIARGERPLRETSPYRNRIGVPLIVGGVAALSNQPLIEVAAATMQQQYIVLIAVLVVLAGFAEVSQRNQSRHGQPTSALGK